MGITNFASYRDDAKPECLCPFLVNIHMPVWVIEILLIHHSNLTC